MKAKRIFTETPEQHIDLVQKFAEIKGVCSHSKPGSFPMGAGRREVVRCSHREYDHCMAPNYLCSFDFCPIIQEEVLNHVRP